MSRLYKTINNVLHYWEAWTPSDKIVIMHWGVVGDCGEVKEIEASSSDCAKIIRKNEKEFKQNGYRKINFDNHFVVLIEYIVDDFGTPEDLAKRHALQDRMQETLGWAGVGHCDGGSIGSGTMEVCCYVVDVEIAKKVIEEDLRGTEFENYTRIFEEYLH